MKKRKEYDDDNGQTFAEMNVDGMPWYDPNRKDSILPDTNYAQRMELSGKDKFHAFLGILAAVAVVTVVFAAIYFLVILAMTVIWNR